jgi:exodeoxyribonuclease VII large subunit
VQGAEAPSALVAALQRAAQRAEVQTLLLVRGGGSLEDLWAFNDERVVRAVAACPIPVICGVGHETDITLADLAADLRAPTPTAAAELAAPSRAELLQVLESQQALLRRGIERALRQHAQRLDTAALRLGRPAAVVHAQTQKLMQLQARLRRALDLRRAFEQQQPALRQVRLARAMQRALQAQQQALAVAGQRLSSLDPAKVLQRGYAWVEGEGGRPVVSAAALSVGQTVRAVWADGHALAEVREVQTLPGAG